MHETVNEDDGSAFQLFHNQPPSIASVTSLKTSHYRGDELEPDRFANNNKFVSH